MANNLKKSVENKGKGIVYILEDLSADSARIRKRIGDKVVETYEISDGACSCKGWKFTGDCKHIDMMVADPPTKAKTFEEAQEIARQFSRELKKDAGTSEVKIIGDIANRSDLVRSIHFVSKSTNGVANPYRMIMWVEDGLAVMIDVVNGDKDNEVF